MSSYNTIKSLVADKRYPLKPAGVKIDVCPTGDCGDKCRYNAVPGELMIIDLEKRETIGVAEIPTVKKLAIAKAKGVNGCTTDLQYLFHDNFNLCEHNFDINTSSPNCGKQQIIDVWFPSCVRTDSTFGFGIWLDDSYVRSTRGHNDKLLYQFVVDNYKAGCTSCDDKAVCEDLLCQLVDKINGKMQGDPTKIQFGMSDSICNSYQPFRAARLFPGTKTTKHFCLTLSGTECEECVYLPGITGISIDGIVTQFNYTVDPSDPTRSLVSQIDRIVTLINRSLDQIGGSAFRGSGIGKCCGHSIQINTCATTVELVTSSGNIAPCLEEDVAVTKPATRICKDCGNDPNPEEMKCGMRLFLSGIELPCHCTYPPNVPGPSTYVRTIEVGMASADQGSTDLYVIEVQKPENPEGYGYFYQQMSRWDTTGGEGFDRRYTNNPVGLLGLPDAGSRDANSQYKCDESYCVYDFEVHYSQNNYHNNQLKYYQKDKRTVSIPSSNSVLIGQWEAILLALKDRGLCGKFTINCDIQ